MRPDASKKIATVTPKKGPNVVVIGAVVAVLVVLAVVVAIVIGNNSKSSTSASGNPVPVGVVGGTGGGILVDPAAKAGVPTVEVYADFQCPICGQFEKAFGPTLTKLAKTGEIKYVVHMMTFLDTNLGNDSSKRATNAAACAADAGKFGEYHSAVFAAQPAKEGDGYTDAQLTEFATTAGITGPALATWQQCTSSGQHNQYVADVADTSGRAGITSTPTVKLNGKDITKTLTTPDALIAQIKAAKS
jgi:protein-disulfide isomerase